MTDRPSMPSFWAPLFQIWLVWAMKVNCISGSP